MPEKTPRRTHYGARIGDALAAGRLELQRCAGCAAVQYPPAEICRHCLGGELTLAPFDPRGTVIAAVSVHRSHRADFAERGPFAIASVKLEAGPIVFAHVVAVHAPGTAVELVALTDRLGDGVFGAVRNDAEKTKLKARFARI